MNKNTNSLPFRILIVDDNTAIQGDFCKILTGALEAPSRDMADMEALLFGAASSPESAFENAAEFVVDCTSQGEDGLEMVQRAQSEGRPYAMAFVDGRMPPGWDGVETIRHLWRISPDLQVVLATAYSDYSWREIQRELGPTDSLLILKKPFDNLEVLQLAHALTRKWALNREVEGRLHALAFYDPLTSLPNRALFLDRLQQALDAAARKMTSVALLFIDLDNFKRINDTLGHSVGDQTLVAVAQRMKDALRSTDVVTSAMASRLGGDEYIVLLPEVDKEEFAAVVAQRLADRISAPMVLNGHQLIITPSIGIALYPQDAENAEMLMKNADLAMYHAKRNGRNTFTYFKESMNATALHRLTLENQLRRAIEREELELAFQPQLDIQNERLSGMEALLRWHNRELGNVAPDEFIPVAEECGLIFSIGEWVMRAACQQAKSWIDQGLPLHSMAVNVSLRQLRQSDFVTRVKAVLAESGLAPNILELEVTESMGDQNAEELAGKLAELRQEGVRIAVDDFGTGFSSLSRLKHLPIDSLKIDRSFILGMHDNTSDKAIIDAILAMAEGLNLSIVAEGVEMPEQRDYLKERHCKHIQGYLYSRPLSRYSAESFLRQNMDGMPASTLAAA